MNLSKSILTVLTVAGLASAASASTRSWGLFNNVDSEFAATTQTRTIDGLGPYTVNAITVEGTLEEVQLNTYACEAVIRVISPAGQQFILQPFNFQSFSGSVSCKYTYQLPVPVLSTGTWTFSFTDMYDDGAGADSRWNSVRISLNDGAPNAADAGSLESGRSVLPAEFLSANETKWYAFTLLRDVNAGSFTYLDIDTEGNTLGAEAETVIALYDGNGNRVAWDDDDGAARASQLTFGAGTRPAVGNGLLYDGRDGALKAGKYYLAVRSYDSNAPGELGFDCPSSSGITGTARVTLRTNAGASLWCPADWDRSGSQNLDDIFIFINDWFAGCF
jgi:hypothetical protein